MIRLHVIALCWLLGPLSCGARGSGPRDAPDEPREQAAPLRGWHYDVTVPQDLRRLEVRLCFQGHPAATLAPGREEAWSSLQRAGTTGPSSRALPRHERNHTLSLEGVPPGGCVEYTVGLDQAGIRGPDGDPETIEAALTKAGQWLWAPHPRPSGSKITARFHTSPDHHVSVPWPSAEPAEHGKRPTTYAIDDTAYRWLGYTAFGAMPRHDLRIADLQMTVVEFGTPLSSQTAGLKTWLGDAARATAMLFDGEFPIDHLQVLVHGTPRGDGEVHFGRVARGGGASVYLLVDATATPSELVGGWTTIHEFMHLAMPYIRDAWMSEGIASYYTEVLRTRMGHRSEREGWQHLERAFARGRQDDRGLTMRETSQRMHALSAYQRVYWSGAAVAFSWDVALRVRSEGRLSLDDAVRELHRCCRDMPRQISAPELLEHLDRWVGEPLFTSIARRHLDAETFPDVRAEYQKLGIDVSAHDEVRLDDEHPHAELRQGIMQPRRNPQATR